MKTRPLGVVLNFLLQLAFLTTVDGVTSRVPGTLRGLKSESILRVCLGVEIVLFLVNSLWGDSPKSQITASLIA